MGRNGRTALVTGASGGIGRELSKLFAADGYDVVLIARSESRLQTFATDLSKAYGVKAVTLSYDLGDPAAADAIWSDMKQQEITVDVLVNNAGFGLLGDFAETDWQEEQSMLNLNVVTLTVLTKRFLPGMVSRGWGRVLNVGSTASFQPVPSMAIYGATKAYVLSFSEALAQEVKGTGVSVTALCPGVTRTGFQARARVGGSRLVGMGIMSAERVARVGYRALMRGRAVIVPGLLNQVMAFSVRLMPRALIRWAGQWMMAGGH
ncbi:MAG: SDR family oxidoreductase [Anaerolineae bacterium]|nr:SDR family oxidoreductase [Anaerolineae bacterium]